MTPKQARELLIRESTEETGALVRLRIGDDPGADRMERLLEATKVVFDDLHGDKTIDRGLAAALHQLAVQIEAQVGSWEMRGRTWREELVDDEVPRLALAVESIFSDEWLDD